MTVIAPPADDERAVSWIGIGVAIAGNVVISLALNLQKLAHRRLNGDLSNDGKDRENGLNGIGVVHEEEDQRQAPSGPEEDGNSHAPVFSPPEEAAPNGLSTPKAPKIIVRPGSPPSNRGKPRAYYRPENRNSPSARLLRDGSPSVRRYDAVQPPPIAEDPEDEPVEEQDKSYLRSKLWWAGLLLMSLGETGNFLSYAYASASIVAPLGTVALIANCIFAPLLLRERLHRLELFGVALAIIGAVTVVASSDPSDIRISPHGLIEAIFQPAFIAYTLIYLITGAILSYLSNTRLGEKFVLVDVGLCGLFGGFTVLSTKGVSSMLTLKGFIIFKEWITYPFLVVLAVTAIGQIKYLNRALMKFDSKVVVPTQFVFFNLSAIIGSAILYSEFENMEFHRFITFLYGCATTFLGVFCLTYRPKNLFPTEEQPESQMSAESTPLIPLSNPAVLRSRTSSASLGLSPGKYLLIATDNGSPATAIPIGSGSRSRTMSASGGSGSAGTVRNLWRPSSAV